jgi:hypothetical protein
MAHQAILEKLIIEDRQQDEPEEISLNDDKLPFLGPNTVVISLNLSKYYHLSLRRHFFHRQWPIWRDF